MMYSGKSLLTSAKATLWLGLNLLALMLIIRYAFVDLSQGVDNPIYPPMSGVIRYLFGLLNFHVEYYFSNNWLAIGLLLITFFIILYLLNTLLDHLEQKYANVNISSSSDYLLWGLSRIFSGGFLLVFIFSTMLFSMVKNEFLLLVLSIPISIFLARSLNVGFLTQNKHLFNKLPFSLTSLLTSFLLLIVFFFLDFALTQAIPLESFNSFVLFFIEIVFSLFALFLSYILIDIIIYQRNYNSLLSIYKSRSNLKFLSTIIIFEIRLTLLTFLVSLPIWNLAILNIYTIPYIEQFTDSLWLDIFIEYSRQIQVHSFLFYILSFILFCLIMARVIIEYDRTNP